MHQENNPRHAQEEPIVYSVALSMGELVLRPLSRAGLGLGSTRRVIRYDAISTNVRWDLDSRAF